MTDWTPITLEEVALRVAAGWKWTKAHLRSGSTSLALMDLAGEVWLFRQNPAGCALRKLIEQEQENHETRNPKTS